MVILRIWTIWIVILIRNCREWLELEAFGQLQGGDTPQLQRGRGWRDPRGCLVSDAAGNLYDVTSEGGLPPAARYSG